MVFSDSKTASCERSLKCIYHSLFSGDSIDIFALFIANIQPTQVKIVAKIMDEIILEMGLVS
jgi:hypothetical protein